MSSDLCVLNARMNLANQFGYRGLQKIGIGLKTASALHKMDMSLSAISGGPAGLLSIDCLSLISKPDVDLSGLNLMGTDLRNRDLSWVNLGNTNLSRANLTNTNLMETNLIHANLSGADLSRANLSGSTMQYANAINATFTAAKLNGTNLSHADFKAANLEDANLQKALLYGTVFSSGSIFTRTNFKDARMQITIDDISTIRNAFFGSTNFNFSTISSVDLSGKDLGGNDFSNVRFQNVNLTNASFGASNLLHATISGNCEGTNFGTSILTFANLIGSSINGRTILCNAILTNCDLPLSYVR